MKPRIILAESKAADGGALVLLEHDGAFAIHYNGQELVHSNAVASEKLLGKLGVEQVDSVGVVRVLIGGLGLGFTLGCVLESLGPDSKVVVVERLPEVIDWNRRYLAGLNGALLDDPRVVARPGDVVRSIRQAKPETWDVILLDVDNGPLPLVATKNATLYSDWGVGMIFAALKPAGRAVFWSPGPDEKFAARLSHAGFRVRGVPSKVHERARRDAYMLYVADK